MTIGIGACGKNAGKAVFAALRVVEKSGLGAIGGFATFTVISKSGKVLSAVTQRGGTLTLFTDGEATGVEPPEEFASAEIAGVISSGPDRPVPLEQFIPAQSGVGLVTGHRIPPASGSNGKPMNQDLLERMKQEINLVDAVEGVVDASPTADCGLIGVSCNGQTIARNTARVKARPDVGITNFSDSSCSVSVLYNAIKPKQVLADLAAAVAVDSMSSLLEPKGWITLMVDTPISMGAENAVFCNEQKESVEVTTTDPAIGERGEFGAAVYLGSKVVIGNQTVGHTMFEPIITIKNGKLIEFSGKNTLKMSYN